MEILGYKEAVSLIAKATSPRAKSIAQLRAYVDGTQYDGRCDWFASGENVPPLYERKPCVVDPIVCNAISQKVDLVCGEGRFPDITSRAAYDILGDYELPQDNEGRTLEEGDPGHEAAESGPEKVDEEVASKVDKCLATLEKSSKLRKVAREALDDAMGCKSVAVIFGVRSNRPFAELVRGEWCTPELNAEGECTSITIMYGFVEIVTDGDRQRAVPKMFHRVIDESRDVTYIPKEILASMNELNMQLLRWQENPELTVSHGLGFCPVRWYQHLAGAWVAGSFDGHAIHENNLDEIDAYNFSLSQRHRAALYAGDPQWTEIGVELGYNPSGRGRPANVMHQSTPQGGPVSGGAAFTGEVHKGGYIDGSSSTGKGTRKKGPGEIWQYSGDPSEIEVQLHTLPGDALKALEDNAKDLERKLEKAFGIVAMDPERIPKGNVLAASAMKTLKAYMHASCDRIRADFGECFLLPAYGMLLRIAVVKKLRIPGIKEATDLLERVGEDWSWSSPPFELTWGDYDTPDPADQLALVNTMMLAQEAGFATKRVCVTVLKGILGVGQNIDAYLEELEKQKAEDDKAEQATADAEHQRELEVQNAKQRPERPM